jgi:hypothetical protein
MDTSEPELTHELWRSGEVQEKRAQIRQLILDLSENYAREKEKKEDEKKALKQKETEEKLMESEKGKELEMKAVAAVEEGLPPKPMETPSTQTVAETTTPPDPPTKRRKQQHPIKLGASNSEIITVID